MPTVYIEDGWVPNTMVFASEIRSYFVTVRFSHDPKKVSASVFQIKLLSLAFPAEGYFSSLGVGRISICIWFSTSLNYFETFYREAPELDAGETTGRKSAFQGLMESWEKLKGYLGRLLLLLFLESANVPYKMKDTDGGCRGSSQ